MNNTGWEINETIGTNIRNLRRVSGVSQTDMGALLGVAFQQVQKYEKGINRLSAADIVRFNREYGWSLEEMLGDLPVKEMSKTCGKLVGQINQLSEEDRKFLLITIKHLLRRGK